MIWRFSPMADPLVEEFHSRDLDSLIMRREVAAVNDWKENRYVLTADKHSRNISMRSLCLQSDAIYHLMRDNPLHNTVIMGGMFGIRRPTSGEQSLDEHLIQMRTMMGTMLAKTLRRKDKGLDQTVLKTVMWPVMLRDKKSTVAHDSYSCDRFRKGTIMRPFPTKREASEDFTEGGKNNFVGSNGGSLNLDRGVCPSTCRPGDHKDWKLC